MSPISLSSLLTAGTPYEWHDAVALVAQLISQTRRNTQPQKEPQVPDVNGIALEDDGTLALALGPGRTLPAMPGAVLLLQQLLTGLEQPTPLWLFVTQTANTVPPPSIDEFADELTRWERPNRAAKLVDFHSRASARISGTEPTSTPETWAAHKVDAHFPPAPTKKPRAAKKKARSDRIDGRRRAAVIAALLAGMGLIAAAWFAMTRSGFEAAIPTPSAVNAFINMPAAAREVPGLPAEPTLPLAGARNTGTLASTRTGRASDAAGTAVANEELDRARRLFEAQQYAAATERFTSVIEMLGQDDTPQARELRQISEELAARSRAAADAAVAGAVEYRAGDPGVVEAMPLSLLPATPRPGTDPNRIEVLELHIDETGNVASAHFVMKQPTFRNRWMVSAAKAWRFEPATRDGQPVRFVTHVLLDDGDQPR